MIQYRIVIRTLFIALVALTTPSIKAKSNRAAIVMPPSVSNLLPTPQRVEMLSDKLFELQAPDVVIDSNLNLPAEGYILESSPKGIKITARDYAGAIWARQTLRQIQVTGRIPHLRITDYPAFALRGFMHDTGRNFMTIDMLKRHIDILSAYKVNVFQWHLTDYPAWRIESRAYPKLNDSRYQRAGRDEGKFYTYGQIRDLIDYAARRGVMVIPEIDIPGHSTYFNTTFGFGMASPEGMKVLEVCFNEFFAEISAARCPYMHIGSDEVHIDKPKEFMIWADSLVRANGRTPMSWDPGLPAAEGTVRQIWSDAAAKATQVDLKSRFVDSFMGYLNFYDPTIFVTRMFLHNPAGRAVGDSLALGGILCLWNDVRVADKKNITALSSAWSGLLPFAERFWHGGLTASGVIEPNFAPDPTSEAGVALAQFERKMAYHGDLPRGPLHGESFDWVPNASHEWQITTPLARGADTVGVRWHTFWGGSLDLDAFAVAQGLRADSTYDLYARRVIVSPCDTTIRAMLGFEAPARSNRISGGIAPQGEWENEGRITVNGQPIAPPVWNEPGAYKFDFHTWHKPQEEIPYTDEQIYWRRQPVEIKLRKGENIVEVFAPKTFTGQRWSFALLPL